jgi:AcrR family transcriptional regulator
VDDDMRFIPRSGPMFSGGSLAKADLATNLAIPLMAEGGWSALTLRNISRAANVTPQAIAAWFPSVDAMRAAIAERYGQRWIRERSCLARRAIRLPQPDSQPDSETVAVPRVALAMLPATWLEDVFDGVWLTVVEAGRWDEAVGSAVAAVQESERDLVDELLAGADGRDEVLKHEVDLMLAIVRGLRASRARRSAA